MSAALALPALERRSLAQRLWQLVGQAKGPDVVVSVTERIQRLHVLAARKRAPGDARIAEATGRWYGVATERPTAPS